MNPSCFLGPVVLSALAFTSCSSTGGQEPAEASAHHPPDSRNRTQLLTSPSSIEDVHDTTINGVHFLATMDTPPHHLTTDDTSFRTPEGAHVGMRLSEAEGLTADSVAYLHQWGYVLKFPSGWTAGFAVEDFDKPAMASDPSIGWLYRQGS